MLNFCDILAALIYMPWALWQMLCDRIDPQMPEAIEAATFAGVIFGVTWPLCVGCLWGLP